MVEVSRKRGSDIIRRLGPARNSRCLGTLLILLLVSAPMCA